jgi:uncharacterized protein (TIGR02145 family)
MKINLVFILILIATLLKSQVPSTPFVVRRPQLVVTSMTLSVSGSQIAYDFRIADGGSTPVECGFIYSYNTYYPNGDSDPNDQTFTITTPANHNGVITGTTSISFLIAPYYFIPYVRNKHNTVFGSRVVLAPNWPIATIGTKVWLGANLGASRVATSATDTDSWGFKYQWGRASDGHQVPTSTTTITRSDDPGHGLFITTNYSGTSNWRSNANTSLWTGVSGTNNPCPSGWRIPTKAEWEAVVNDIISKPSSYNLTGNRAFSESALKIPTSQGRDRNTANVEINNVGNMYWFVETSAGNSANLMFPAGNSSGWRYDGGGEAYGGAVRCVQN